MAKNKEVEWEIGIKYVFRRIIIIKQIRFLYNDFSYIILFIDFYLTSNIPYNRFSSIL